MGLLLSTAGFSFIPQMTHTILNFFRYNVAESEANLSLLLGTVGNISSELARTAFNIGPALDDLLKLLMKFYNTIGLLAKYFFVKCKLSKRSVQIAKFDKLVGHIGSTTTQHVYKWITIVQVLMNQDKIG